MELMSNYSTIPTGNYVENFSSTSTFAPSSSSVLLSQPVSSTPSLSSSSSVVTYNQLQENMDNISSTTTAAVTAVSTAVTNSLLPFIQQYLNNTRGIHINNYNETFEIDDMPCPSIQNSFGHAIAMILYSIVCIVGLFGNTLVIYVVLRFSKMQTVTNMYILNLALADECYLIGIPFLLITMHLGNWTFGEGMCKAYMVSTSITQFTSSIFLLIMSADRYIAVCHPISSPRFRTPFVSKIVSGVAWTMSAVIMLPVILFANTIETKAGKFSCIIRWPESHGTQSGTTFTLYSLGLGFAIPLSFILCFYYLVIRKLHTVGPKNKSKEKKRSHRKVTKLVLTVITVYILCWLPHWISQVALIHSPPQDCRSRLEITIFLLVGCLGYSNSAMNPILYAFLSDNFKKSFLKACTCAAGKELNAQLQLENSLFPKFGKNSGSERLLSSSKHRQHRTSTNMGTNSAVTIAAEQTTTVTMTGRSISGPSGVPLAPSALINMTPARTGLKETAIDKYETEDEKPPVLHTDL